MEQKQQPAKIKIDQVIHSDVLQALGNQKLKDFIDKPISDLIIVLRPILSLSGLPSAAMSEEPALNQKIKELEKQIEEFKKQI